MVIDTSAVAAVLFEEAEGERFEALIAGAAIRLVSAATAVEVTLVVEGRYGSKGRDQVDRFLRATGAEIVPVTADQVELAREAWRRFGKGNHPAALNFGDCFAYALAKASGEPLLFKGGDFARTDLATAA